MVMSFERTPLRVISYNMAPIVKRLRHLPLTQETKVRFLLESLSQRVDSKLEYKINSLVTEWKHLNRRSRKTLVGYRDSSGHTAEGKPVQSPKKVTTPACIGDYAERYQILSRISPHRLTGLGQQPFTLQMRVRASLG